MRMKPIIGSIALLFLSMPLQAQQNDDLVAKGRYIATVGDCAACHGENFAGGAPVSSPLGAILAPNITFDDTGIKGWSEQQFADALRKGRAPVKGWLYPAMPYTSYTGMSDDDVHALYTYLKTVPPVSRTVTQTELPFPFYRPAMAIWNILNLDYGRPAGAVEVQGGKVQRGRYLVETLGHCSTCHTPRGSLMGQEDGKHLGGATQGNWHAPNITSDPSGIGGWSAADFTQFLQTGHNQWAVASGDMGLVVSRSLSHLTDSDIAAMVAYLRQVPPVKSEPLAPVPLAAPAANIDKLETPLTDWHSRAAADTTDGAILYQSACASCHGVTGGGGAGPSLAQLDSVRAQSADNLVQVLARGDILQGKDGIRLMPGFQSTMNHQQLAAVANYVRTHIGGMTSATVTADQVKTILSGKQELGWLLNNAAVLAWAGILLVLLVILLLIYGLTRLVRSASRT